MLASRALARLLLSLGLAAAAALPASAATLFVDDTDAAGVIGDERLSLGEAIRLAGGVLALGALSDAEREHVLGEPGAGSADLVRVTLRRGTIQTPAGADVGLPVLLGNEDDVFDGGGVTLQSAGGSGSTGMETASSRIVIRRFSFVEYARSLVVGPTPGPGDLEAITITGNAFAGYVSGVEVAPNPAGSKGLRGLRIEGNRFTTALGQGWAIAVQGASPVGAAAEAADFESADVVIRGNEIAGGVEGIGVFGGIARPGTTVRDGRLHDVEISGNRIRDVFDLPIAVLAGFVIGEGVVTRVEVSDVLVAGNLFATDGTPSIHVWAVAGTAVGEPGGLAEDNHLHDLTIVRNRGTGGGECPGGIQLQGGQNELGGGVVRGNVLERAVVASNAVSGCGSALALFGAVVAAGHGLVEQNTLRDVLLSRNRLTDNVRGVIVSGAVGLEGSAFPLPGAEKALAQQNVADAVEVSGNRIRGGMNGILAIGGISNATSDDVLANEVSSSFESRNAVRGAQVRCNVIDDVVIGDAGGSAADNQADFTCSEAP